MIGIGLAAGFFSGLFGVGGGLIVVPGLVVLLGLDQRRAVGTSLLAIVPAVGASLGVSAAGLYSIRTKAFDMQGVVSPIYLLNGIGAVLTRRGEGLFGFNYKLRGTADDPKVSVNPLSILTPGMFRELFRRAPPTLEGQG